MHSPEEDYWRPVIASPIISRQGSAAGYLRLNEVLRAIELAGVTLEDISVLDPASSQFQSLRSLAGASGRLAAGPEWIEFEEAIVYRWTHESIDADLDCDVSASELNIFWEPSASFRTNQRYLLAPRGAELPYVFTRNTDRSPESKI